jgi:hypothetical protein
MLLFPISIHSQKPQKQFKRSFCKAIQIQRQRFDGDRWKKQSSGRLAKLQFWWLDGMVGLDVPSPDAFGGLQKPSGSVHRLDVELLHLRARVEAHR